MIASGKLLRSSAPPKPFRNVSLIVAIAIIVISAGVISYYYLAYSPAQQTSSCAYSPGDGLYIQITNSTNGTVLRDLSMKGELISGCAPSSATIQIPTIEVLGTWTFQTNATGFVSVPTSDLSGNAFWFYVTSGTTTYEVKSPICGEGVTIVQLGIPSGIISGREIPTTGGITVSQGANGVETTMGCGGLTFQGNATTS